MKTKYFLILIVIVIIISGCSYFATGKKLQQCDSLLVISKNQMVEAIIIVDSLQTRIDTLENKLKECQKTQIYKLKEY